LENRGELLISARQSVGRIEQMREMDRGCANHFVRFADVSQQSGFEFRSESVGDLNLARLGVVLRIDDDRL